MINFFYNSANFELQRILISEIETQVDIFLWECSSIMSRNETDLVKDKTNKTHLRKITFLQRKYPWELLTKLKLRRLVDCYLFLVTLSTLISSLMR